MKPSKKEEKNQLTMAGIVLKSKYTVHGSCPDDASAVLLCTAYYTNPPPAAASKMWLLRSAGTAHQGRHEVLSVHCRHQHHPLMAGRAGLWCRRSDPGAQPPASSSSSWCFSCSCRISLPGMTWSLHANKRKIFSQSVTIRIKTSDDRPQGKSLEVAVPC